MHQCAALAAEGVDLRLYARRAIADDAAFRDEIVAGYGVKRDAIRFITFYGRLPRGDNLRIALFAAGKVLRMSDVGAVLSRNLYYSYLHAVLMRRPLLFETHQLEHGRAKVMQRSIMTKPWVTTIVISRRLQELLAEHQGVSPYRSLVLHDAAPSGVTPIALEQRRAHLERLLGEDLGRWDCVAGYFGHLYAGRGLEIIEAMAAALPASLFLVYGGNDADVEARRAANKLPNLRYMGYVPHAMAQIAMRSIDVLLMPYQASVSIGVAGHDTARWMSPVKMFEYMATGVPVISSDLPVLREVLHDGRNALLVAPADVNGWIAALERLISDQVLARDLGLAAHKEYSDHYTWSQRARRILDAAKQL